MSKPPTMRRVPTCVLQPKGPQTTLKDKTALAVALRHGITRTAPVVLADQGAASPTWKPVARTRRSHCTAEAIARYPRPTHPMPSSLLFSVMLYLMTLTPKIRSAQLNCSRLTLSWILLPPCCSVTSQNRQQ